MKIQGSIGCIALSNRAEPAKGFTAHVKTCRDRRPVAAVAGVSADVCLARFPPAMASGSVQKGKAVLPGEEERLC
jgi:hypothetical protein